MIGGQAKTQEPEAIYLRDGDVVIMSGKARMSYHAVPKVLPLDFQLSCNQMKPSELTKAVPSPNCRQITHVSNGTDNLSANACFNGMKCESINSNIGRFKELCDGEEDVTLSDTEHNLLAANSEQCKRSHGDLSAGDSIVTKRSKSESDNTSLTELINTFDDDNVWAPFNNYLQTSRININVRQLFESGKGPDDYDWPTEDPYKVT